MRFTDLFKKRKSVPSKSDKQKKKSRFAIEMKNVTKTFLGGKIIANSNVNINVK